MVGVFGLGWVLGRPNTVHEFIIQQSVRVAQAGRELSRVTVTQALAHITNAETETLVSPQGDPALYIIARC